MNYMNNQWIISKHSSNADRNEFVRQFSSNDLHNGRRSNYRPPVQCALHFHSVWGDDNSHERSRNVCVEAFWFYFIPSHLSQFLYSSWILPLYHIQFSLFPFWFSFLFLFFENKILKWLAAMSRQKLIFFHELAAKTYSLWLWINRTLIVTTWDNVRIPATVFIFFIKRYSICFVFAKVCLQLMFSSCLCLWVSFRLVSSILCFLYHDFFHRM